MPILITLFPFHAFLSGILFGHFNGLLKRSYLFNIFFYLFSSLFTRADN